MHFLQIRISGISLNPDTISELLKLKPTTAYKKGDIKYFRNNIITYDEGCFVKQVEVSEEQDLETTISNFLLVLIPYKYELIQISKEFKVVLWLTLYPETEQMHFHFSTRVINLINELGIDIGFSVMSLQSFYDANY